MSIELCDTGSQPFSSNLTVGVEFPITANQTCLLTFQADVASTLFVGFLLQISQQMGTTPSFQFDVYTGNAGPDGGTLISSFNLGQNSANIDMAASFGNISAVFTTGPEPLPFPSNFNLSFDSISNYTMETINFENQNSLTHDLLVPNALEAFSYTEILIIACPDCLIRFMPDGQNIFVVFDGSSLTSPRLGQFNSNIDSQTNFTSTGNMILIQIANFDTSDPSALVNAGTVTELVSSNAIVCTSAETRVYLDETLLNQLLIQPNDDTVASNVQVNSNADVPSMCVPVVQISSLHFYRFGISDCGAQVHANETHQTFSYLFWKIPNEPDDAVLQRFSDACLNLTCTYETELNVTSNNVAPSPIKVDLLLEAQDANFEFEYKFYNSSSFADPIPADQYFVSVPDFVYFSLEIQSSLNIEACTCWATPDAVLTNPVQYILLEESCPTDEMFDNSPAVELYSNGNESVVRAAFRSYRWNRLVKRGGEFINGTGPPSPIFIHCSVRICDDEQNALFCDSVDCLTSRNKRSLDTRKTQIMSSGGIFIDPYQEHNRIEDACKEHNGGCREGCLTDYRGDPICFCYGGKILQADGSCADRSIQELNTKEEQVITNYLFVDMIAIVSVAFIVFAVVKYFTKDKANVVYTKL